MATNYTAVWRPGSGAQFWGAGLSAAEFKEKDTQHFSDGLRLTKLQVDGDRFAAVWRPGSGAQHWQIGMSISEFESEDAVRFRNGMRLVCLDCTNDLDSDDGWYAVWRSGSGTQFWRTGIDWDRFKEDDENFFRDGLRLVTLRHDAGGSETFVGVWRPGSGGQHIWWHEPVDMHLFAQKNAEREAGGERLVALPMEGLNAVWQSGTGSSPFLFAADLDTFRSTEARLFEEGFRLSDFNVAAWF